jgi:hypothetical protein
MLNLFADALLLFVGQQPLNRRDEPVNRRQGDGRRNDKS